MSRTTAVDARLRAGRGLAAALALCAGAAGAQSAGPAVEVDAIVVRKVARTLTLYAQGRAVHTIGGLQFGAMPWGPKRFEGDERTPEGRYTIDFANPDSGYHLSLRISYPSAADRAHARSLGRSPGGLIFIHGQPNGLGRGARLPGDWTDGCIAVSNAEMELLWETVPDGTVIDILP